MLSKIWMKNLYSLSLSISNVYVFVSIVSLYDIALSVSDSKIEISKDSHSSSKRSIYVMKFEMEISSVKILSFYLSN